MMEKTSAGIYKIKAKIYTSFVQSWYQNFLLASKTIVPRNVHSWLQQNLKNSHFGEFWESSRSNHSIWYDYLYDVHAKHVENQVNLMILIDSRPSLKASCCSGEKNFFLLLIFKFMFCRIP